MTEREIVQTALGYEDPVQRQRYLDRVCGADAALRLRIEAQLVSTSVGQLNSPQTDSSIPGSSIADSSIADSAASSVDVAGEPTGELDTRSVSSDSLNFTFDEDTDDALELSFLQPTSELDGLGKLDHYQILEVLGRGAFGTVFKAFDEKLHRMSAIKVMDPRLSPTLSHRRRFLREARSAAAIRHENVVQIYGVEELPLPYLVMEYIDGETLWAMLQRMGPLDLATLLSLGRQIASGLAAAHAQGLVHRDIKPSNILLTVGPPAQVKITDFGLARAVDDVNLTRSGTIMGTPAYMSPEQAQGLAIDHRADLFSLGSVLYFMAVGRAPFKATTTVAILRQVTDEAPQPVSQIADHVPPWLCSIIQKLHSKRPEDRFQSAQEVADILSYCQQHLNEHGTDAGLQASWTADPGLSVTQPPELAEQVVVQPSPASASSRQPSIANRSRMAVALSVAAVLVMMLEIFGLTDLRALLAPRLAGQQTDRNTASQQMALDANSGVGSAADAAGQVGASEALPGNNPASLRFADTSEVVVPTLVGLPNPAGSFTIEAAFTSELAHERHANIVDFDKQAVLRIGSIEQRITFTTYRNEQRSKIEVDETANVGKRVHVAVVRDTSEVRIYVDGKLKFRQAEEAHPLDAAEGLQIGRHYTGLMHWIRISSSARYNGDFTPIESCQGDADTLAVYCFREGEGRVLQDSSGNGHDGLILGAEWIRSGGTQAAEATSESPGVESPGRQSRSRNSPGTETRGNEPSADGSTSNVSASNVSASNVSASNPLGTGVSMRSS